MTTTCIYCGNAFTPIKATTIMCAGCWFGGRHHEAQHPDLLYALRSVPGVDSATIDHTGGGCFGLAIRLTDKRFFFATLAYKDDGGEWSCDVGVPDAGEPWGLGIYTSEDGEEDGGFYSGQGTEPIRCPLTDAELIAAVRTLVAFGV